MSALDQQAITAVLFDFDGVIGMTMEDNYRAWRQVFAEVGIALEAGDYYRLEGLSPLRLAEHLLARHGHSSAAAAELARRKDACYLADNRFALYPGAAELVASLAGRVRLALVTGASAERLAATLPADLLDCFDAVVTAGQTAHPKPAPDPYLRAAALLGVEPGNCLVVENAPLGIESAKTAGMACVAVCSTLPAAQLAQADQVVADLNAVAELFATLFMDEEPACALHA